MRRTPAPGFTLLEMLMAVSVTALLVILLFQTFSSLSSIWRRSEERTSAFREARAALRFMERDLSKVICTGTVPALHFTRTSGTGNFFSEVTAIVPMKNEGKSDLCSVRFYAAWDSTANVYALNRGYQNSDSLYPNILAGPAPTPTDDVLAAYAWDLELRPFDASGVFITTLNSTYPDVPDFKDPLPAGVEISFKAISAQATQKLHAQNITAAQWSDTTSVVYKNEIAPAMEVFRTRVHFAQETPP